MIMYDIKEPYTTAMYLLKPTTISSKGVQKKSFQKCKDARVINCLFKTYGGTVSIASNEKSVNDIVAVVDTAIIETWYDPEITSNCRLAFDDNSHYEILGNPENISMRNKTLKIRLKKVSGGA